MAQHINYGRADFPAYTDGLLTSEYGVYPTTYEYAPTYVNFTVSEGTTVHTGDASGRPTPRIRLDLQHGETTSTTERVEVNTLQGFGASLTSNGIIETPSLVLDDSGVTVGRTELDFMNGYTMVRYRQLDLATDLYPDAWQYDAANVHRASIGELRLSSKTTLTVSFYFDFDASPDIDENDEGIPRHAAYIKVYNTCCTQFGNSTLTTPAYGNKLSTKMGDAGDTDTTLLTMGLTNAIVLTSSAGVWELLVNNVVIETGAHTAGDERELSLEWCPMDTVPDISQTTLYNSPIPLRIYYRVRERAYGGAWDTVVDSSKDMNVDLSNTSTLYFSGDFTGVVPASGDAYILLELLQSDTTKPCIRMEEFHNFYGAWKNLNNTLAYGGVIIPVYYNED